MTQPAFSRRSLASWVLKRLAPSTMYGILHLPSAINLFVVDRSIDSGRPPHGTNKSYCDPSRRWKVFRKIIALLTFSPDGNVTLVSSTRTRYPSGDSFEMSYCAI